MPDPGGEKGTLQSDTREGFTPGSNQPHTLLQKSYPFRIPLIEKSYPFHIPSYLARSMNKITKCQISLPFQIPQRVKPLIPFGWSLPV